MTLPLIPFVEAKWFTEAEGRAIDLLVIHDMEAPERATTAEAVARDFQTRPATNKASSHYNVDNDSIVQSVRVKDVAYHAPGANHNGIGIEHAGYAKQTPAEWKDTYSTAMLRLSAELVSSLCAQYDIPTVFVDAAGLRRGERGITTHAAVSAAFHKSTHTDPGPNFPIDYYLSLVRSFAVPPRVRFELWDDGKAQAVSTPVAVGPQEADRLGRFLDFRAPALLRLLREDGNVTVKRVPVS